MDNQPTQKQQVTEIIRQASNVVVTASREADDDQIAAVVAFADILRKLGKKVEAVISKPLPAHLNFLPATSLHQQFDGERDFVMELDTSKTEADKLKYIPDGQKLKIYITPFNGNFTKEDVSFGYGDYHCDAVIALGAASKANIDTALAKKTELLSKAQFLAITTTGNDSSEAGTLHWSDPSATSLCEMLMSITESLQSGLLDSEIATALLTGIVVKTEHFTAANTSPKVMTMAAQLMAAGARQSEIMKSLTNAADETLDMEPKPKPSESNAANTFAEKTDVDEAKPTAASKPGGSTPYSAALYPATGNPDQSPKSPTTDTSNVPLANNDLTVSSPQPDTLPADAAAPPPPDFSAASLPIEEQLEAIAGSKPETQKAPAGEDVLGNPELAEALKAESPQDDNAFNNKKVLQPLNEIEDSSEELDELLAHEHLDKNLHELPAMNPASPANPTPPPANPIPDFIPGNTPPGGATPAESSTGIDELEAARRAVEEAVHGGDPAPEVQDHFSNPPPISPPPVDPNNPSPDQNPALPQ